MKISNVLARAKKDIKISDSEIDMLTNLLGNYEWDGYLTAPKKKIIEAAIKYPHCFILQNGRFLKEKPSKNAKCYGILCGVGKGKILIFPSKI